jgi:hypothetical protein
MKLNIQMYRYYTVFITAGRKTEASIIAIPFMYRHSRDTWFLA